MGRAMPMMRFAVSLLCPGGSSANDIDVALMLL
jgi:hypothetical protein